MLQKGKEREKKRRKFRKGCPNLRRLTGQHSQVEKKKVEAKKTRDLLIIFSLHDDDGSRCCGGLHLHYAIVNPPPLLYT